MASDINTITLTGRIGQKRELKTFADGGGAFNFSLANNRSVKRNGQWEEETDWIECSMTGKRAVALYDHVKKGHTCAVTGSLRVEKWEKNGEKRSMAKVHVREFVFGRPPKSEQQAPHGGFDSASAVPGDNFGPGDDDIPF